MVPRFPVAFRRPAFACWASSARWGTGPSLRSAYRAWHHVPDPDGVITFCTHEMRSWFAHLQEHRAQRCRDSR